MTRQFVKCFDKSCRGTVTTGGIKPFISLVRFVWFHAYGLRPLVTALQVPGFTQGNISGSDALCLLSLIQAAFNNDTYYLRVTL